jgi:hypothetical protein
MKISLKEWRHSVLRSSQPIPPAPTRRARVLENSIVDEMQKVEWGENLMIARMLINGHVVKWGS